MKQRITDCFAKAKSEGRGAFVAYMTIGYPSLEKSEAAVETLISEGADIIELGVPFSDPFADGAVIRAAAYEALRQGVTLHDVIALAKRVRSRHPETGLVLFSYYNLLFANGLEKFADELIASHLPFTVFATSLPFLQACENHQSGDCATHQTHSSHASAKTCGNSESHLLVQSVEVRKGTNYTLTAAVTLHEKLYCSLYAVF